MTLQEPSTLRAYETILALVVAGCTAVSIVTTLSAVGTYRRRRRGHDPVARVVAWMLVRTEAVLLAVQFVSLFIAADRVLSFDPHVIEVWDRYTTYGTARTLISVLIAFKVVLNCRDHARVWAMADAEAGAEPDAAR
jgi:hypothetical protein